MKYKQTGLLFILTLLVSCKNDRRVEPVNPLAASPELRRLQDEIRIEAANAEEQVVGQINQVLKDKEREITENVINIGQELIEKEKNETINQLQPAITELAKKALAIERQNFLMHFKTLKASAEKKYLASGFYFSLMDTLFFYSDISKKDMLNEFLMSTREFFPKKYRGDSAGYISEQKKPSHLDIFKRIKLDLKRDVYGISLGLNAPINQLQLENQNLKSKLTLTQQVEGKTFYLVLLEAMKDVAKGVEYEAASSQEISHYLDVVQANFTKFEYLLQVRHNALYDVAIRSLNKSKINLSKNWRPRNTELNIRDLELIKSIIIEADQTYNDLVDLYIDPIEIGKNREKLNSMILPKAEDIPENMKLAWEEFILFLQTRG